VANSIYYGLPRAAHGALGSSEIAYRLPSVLAMAAALFLAARLARRLIDPHAAWLAVFACLALSGFDYQAADARPYALGACVAAACMWTLVRWLDTARWRDGLLFVVCAALLGRVHPVYWPLYPVFAVYAAARLWRRETRAGWPRVGAVFGLAALALVPAAIGAASLFQQAQAHVIAAQPGWRELQHELRWTVVVICGAGAWLLSRLLRWDGDSVPLRRAGGPPSVFRHAAPSATALILILGWWLAPPLCLFVFSRLSGDSVFLRRYISEMLPGAGLAAAAAAACFAPAARWNRMAAALGAGGLLLLGQWGRLWPAHEHSDWRGAAAAVNRLAAQGTPVVSPSPFIEAKPPAWRPSYPLPGFLYAHLYAYPVAGAISPFPYASSTEAASYAAALASGRAQAAGRLLIYGFSPQVDYWRNWFAARPELAGWKQTLLPFGDVEVAELER
jgi:4-amino-4-deoxy-L-arabinose transferase-like glycosyltransferase